MPPQQESSVAAAAAAAAAFTDHRLQATNEARFGEMAGAIEELRRQLSDVQTEMQRQTALYDLERTQLQKERRQIHEERLRMASLLGDKLKTATDTEQAVRSRMKSLQETMQMIREKSSTLLACSQANTMVLRDFTIEASRRYEDQEPVTYYEDRQHQIEMEAEQAARAFEQSLQISEQQQKESGQNGSGNPFDPRTNSAFSDIPEYCNIQEMQQFWDERHRLAAATSSQNSTEHHHHHHQQQQQQQQQADDKARWDLAEAENAEYMKSSTSFMESYPLVIMKLESFIEEVEKLVETPKSSRDIHFYRKLKSKNRLMRMTYRVFAENLKRYGSPEDADGFRELDEKSLNVLERANKELEDLKKIKMHRYTFNVERSKQASAGENK